MSRFAYPSPPRSVGADARTLSSGTGTPHNSRTDTPYNSSPASVRTGGSSRTFDSMQSGGSLGFNPPSTRNKYSLFPPPDRPNEHIEANLPTLMAARALANAKSVPNFKAISQTATSPDTANIRPMTPRAVSNPESGIRAAIMKLTQKSEYTKRDRGLSFKETFKKILRKKSSSSLDKASSKSEKIQESLSSSSINKVGSPKASPNTSNIPEEDELPDLARMQTRHRVVRRVHSEADFSPKVSKPVSYASTFADIGPPPVQLPPTPEASPYHQRQASSNGYQCFPVRSDSLQYSSANNSHASGSQGSVQSSDKRIHSNDSNSVDNCHRTSIESLDSTSFEEYPVYDAELVNYKGPQDSSSHGDPFYLEKQYNNIANSRAEVYSPFDSQFGLQPEPQQTQHLLSGFVTEVQLHDPFYSPTSVSKKVGLGAPEATNTYQNSSQSRGRGNISPVQYSTSRTGSPSPRSPDPENVPRGILDNFIEKLIRESRDRHGGSLDPIRHDEEDEPKIQLTQARQTLARAVANGEKLDISTTMALADFLMQSVHAFNCHMMAKTEKIQRQRQLLRQQKEELDHAIESALYAQAQLKEEQMCLAKDHEEVMRRSLELAELVDEE